MYLLDLKDLQLDLDDDLFLYSPSNEYWSIWEFYEIHETRPKKILYYGNWHLKEGLSITNEDKWVRRKNLEVCVIKSCQNIMYGFSITMAMTVPIFKNFQKNGTSNVDNFFSSMPVLNNFLVKV